MEASAAEAGRHQSGPVQYVAPATVTPVRTDSVASYLGSAIFFEDVALPDPLLLEIRSFLHWMIVFDVELEAEKLK